MPVAEAPKSAPWLYHRTVAATLKDMSTWAAWKGRDGLCSFTDEDGTFWLEENATKT